MGNEMGYPNFLSPKVINNLIPEQVVKTKLLQVKFIALFLYRCSVKLT